MPLLVLLSLLAPLWARDRTYCVGGYNGKPPGLTEIACTAPSVVALHPAWHHHAYLKRKADGACYDCWDEVDNSCITDFLTNNPDFERVRPKACPEQQNAGEILEHIIDGQHVQETLHPELDSPPGPHEAGDTLQLTGRLRDDNGELRPVDGGKFQIVLPDGSTRDVSGQPQPDGTVRGTVTLPDAANVEIRFLPSDPTNVREAGGAQFTVRRAPTLRLPQRLDFGALVAGTPAKETCQTLDFSQSIELSGRAYRISLEGMDGCEAQPVLFPKEAIDPPLRVPELGATLTVCLVVPYCAADAATADTSLVFTPEDPRYIDRVTRVPLTWTVTGRSWIRCNGIWLGPLLVSGLVGLVLVGFVRPRRFPAEATITVASDPRGLKRAAPIPLRECRGSRPGFYRDARLGVHFDGNVNGNTRSAAALLQATARGVMLSPLAGLEVYDRRKRGWTSPELEDGRLSPSPRDIYRCGDVCFQIDPG